MMENLSAYEPAIEMITDDGSNATHHNPTLQTKCIVFGLPR